MEFKQHLRDLINTHDIDSLAETPDYILADYLVECLANYIRASKEREIWFGRKTEESITKEIN